MTKPKGGLGKGLSALIRSVPHTPSTSVAQTTQRKEPVDGQITQIEISKIQGLQIYIALEIKDLS